MFRRRGFMELGVFVVVTFALIVAVYVVLELLKPLSPDVASFLRNPASPWPIFVACVFASMAIVKAWSRSDRDPRPGSDPAGRPHPRR